MTFNVICYIDQVIQRTYTWESFTSPTKPPHDSGTVAVIDGCESWDPSFQFEIEIFSATILLTPFRTQNVPPPMSSCQLSLRVTSGTPSAASLCHLSLTPIYMSFSPTEDVTAFLWEKGRVEIWNLNTRLGPGRDNVMSPIKIWESLLINDRCQRYRQIKLWTTAQSQLCRIAVLGSAQDGCDMLAVAEIEAGNLKQVDWTRLSKRDGRLVEMDDRISWQAYDGELYDGSSSEVDLDSYRIGAEICAVLVHLKGNRVYSITRFPEFCFSSNRISVSTPAEAPVTLYLGLGGSGKLYLVGASGTVHVLGSQVTSFAVTSGFCIFTTSSHEAIFAPLESLATMLSLQADEDPKTIISGWEKRRVERGSRIVTAVPSTMSLVLQMPRGNLETISPRPLVLEVIKQDLDK
jgi:elongator complex protein 1